MKTFKNSKRYLAFALTFLMPIYANFELLAEQNKEKIEVFENIKNEEEAKTKIEKYLKIVVEYEKNNQLEKAITYLKKVINLEKLFFGVDAIEVAETHKWIADIYLDLGKIKKSEIQINKSLEICKKLNEEKNCDNLDILNTAGLISIELNSYSKATNIFENIIKIEEKLYGNEYENLISSYNNLGAAYYEKRQFNKAINSFKKSLFILGKQKKRDFELDGTLNNNLGYLYLQIGDYEQAEIYLKKSLNIREKYLKNESDLYFSYSALGLLNNEKKNFAKSEKYYLKALEIQKKLYGQNSPNLTFILNNLGMLYQDQKKFDKAIKHLNESKRIMESSNLEKDAYLGRVYINLGNLYAESGLYEDAKKNLQNGIKFLENIYGKDHPTLINGNVSLAYVYNIQKSFEKSEKTQDQVIRSYFNFVKKELPFLNNSSRENFLNKILAEDFYDLIFTGSSKSENGTRIALFTRLNRNGLLQDIEKNQSLISKLKGKSKITKNELKNIINELSRIDLDSKKRKFLLDKKNILETELYSILPQFDNQVIEIKEVSKSLSKDSILIEFQKYKPYKDNISNPSEDRYGEYRFQALLLKPNGDITYKDLGKAQTIEKSIIRALKATEDGLIDANQEWENVGNLVIKPLLSFLNGSKKIFISPDSYLNRVPFTIFTYYQDILSNIDPKDIHIVTSGRELIDHSKNNSKKSNISLVVANPDFDLLKTSSIKKNKNDESSNRDQIRSSDLSPLLWSPLPGTKKEGEAISKLIGAKLLINEKATSVAIQKEISPKVLHIASHAYFLNDKKTEENPLLRSGIVLAGANHPDANKYDDGYLTALEVSQLDLNSTELVVISACDSGLGSFEFGNNLYGLKRSIYVAGAKSSFLSLWKVNDQATAEFMKSFYLKLKNGEGRAEALANTQKEFRNHPIKAWRHPNVWAAFQLSGDWRPIDF